jgi:hypothetical protein
MHITDTANTDELAAFTARVRGRLAEHGALAGLPEGEAFKVIREV